MAELSLRELIDEAARRKISLGENAEETIKFYTKLGFIPKPKRRRRKADGQTITTLHYPEHTIEKLAHVVALKSEGLTLDEVRDTFALEYVQSALKDLLEKIEDEKIMHLAQIISSGEDELESIVMSPLIYLVEGMRPEEAKKLLTLFCGVGFYALLEAQQHLEQFNLNGARLSLTKSLFYNSIAVLKLARTTGDSNLEKTASEVYEKVVLSPIAKASERVRRDFVKSLDAYIREKSKKRDKV